jgi:Domain of unknown function (DUF1844)
MTVAMNEMDEEQPTFKVTDRRLFNPDGSPRELSPEEKPEPPMLTPEPAAAVTAADSGQNSATATQVATESPEQEDVELSEEELEGARDPASFMNFLMSIASNAAATLGMMEHPVTHQREVDLELGKHWIDVIGMLQKKTHGNLAPQEQKMLEGLLADLRMQFVSLANVPQKSRPLSAKDITGGK